MRLHTYSLDMHFMQDKLIKANDKSLNFQIIMVFAHINKKSYELENYLTKNSSKEIISYDFLRK